MIKYFLILLGILTSALAQVMLKKSSHFAFLKDLNFFIYFIAGGLFYLVSFGVYAYVLKIFNISKISPIMTIGTMILVIFTGTLLFKEAIGIKQVVGIVLGMISIILIIR